MTHIIYACRCGRHRRVSYQLKTHYEMRGMYEKPSRREWTHADGRREFTGLLDVPNQVCACGETMNGQRVRGTATKHVCDERSLSATGFQCECSCGGENHGMQLFRPLAV